VIKRKMSNWKLKRTGQCSSSRPGKQAAPTITIVAATKPHPTSRKKRATAN